MFVRLALTFVVVTVVLRAQSGNGQAAQAQAVSVAAMQASIEQQKAAVKAQVSGGGPADAFFSTDWKAPASITVPTLVPACMAMPDSDLKPLVTEASKTHGLKQELILAVMKRESAFYPCALSDRGAIGLMQLLPEVAEQFGADPLDPKQNINAGAQYLKQLMGRYKGDLKLALAAYNAGPQRVDAEMKVPDIPETTAYVEAILKDLTGKQAAPK